MKKIYETPAVLAVILLQQNNLADFSYAGDGSGLGADVKVNIDDLDNFEDSGSTTGGGLKNIWDEEW